MVDFELRNLSKHKFSIKLFKDSHSYQGEISEKETSPKDGDDVGNLFRTLVLIDDSKRTSQSGSGGEVTFITAVVC